MTPSSPTGVVNTTITRFKPNGDATNDTDELLRRRRLFEDGENQWYEFTKAMTEELAFGLDLDHYRDDAGNDRDPHRVQPKGRQLYSKLRHKSGQISRSGIHLDVQPQDEETDPDLAEIVEGLIGGVIRDPMKRYAITRRMVVLQALSARMGAYRIEFDPQVGKFGEIIITPVDARRVRWAPGYDSPHRERCPWFYEVATMPRSEVESMANWKNTKDLVGDKNVVQTSTHRNESTAGTVDLNASSNAPNMRPGEEPMITVVFLYERNRPSKATVKSTQNFTPLAPEDMFHSCMQQDQTGCGYSSETYANGNTFPQADVPIGCPTCGGNLMLNTATPVDIEQESPHTLTIFAPYENGEGVEFFGGPWPHNTRSVPYLVWIANVHPVKVMGQSDTSLDWTLQLSSNLCLRIGLENMLLAKPYIWFQNPVCDGQGQPFLFDGTQGMGIYSNGELYQHAPQLLQSAGIPAALPTLNQMIDGALRSDLGTNDITFDNNQSRDIPVGTIQTLEKLGEIPVQDQIESFQLEESVAFSIVLDIIRACYTQKRLTRMKGADGIKASMAMRGSDLPGFDVTVTADPMSKMPEAEDIQKLITIAQTPSYIRDFLARAFNIPRSLMQQLTEGEQEFQQAQYMQAMKANALTGGGTGPGRPGVATSGVPNPASPPVPSIA